jgi:hypothetical protein
MRERVVVWFSFACTCVLFCVCVCSLFCVCVVCVTVRVCEDVHLLLFTVWYGRCVVQLEIGHLQRATGASRQYNFVDWDGSATRYPFGEGNPVIVGASDSEQLEVLGTSLPVRDWWKLANNCKERTDWKVWTCPKNSQQEIANIGTVCDVIQDGCG